MRHQKAISPEAINESVSEMKRDIAYKITTICIISTVLLYVLLLLHKYFIAHTIPFASFLRLAVMLATMLAIDSVSLTYRGRYLFTTYELKRLFAPSMMHVKIIATYIINYICAYYYIRITHPQKAEYIFLPSMSLILHVWR
jgi:hypothetical protein